MVSTNTHQIITPKTDQEFKQYYDVRWQLLRKPWQQPEGSEKDELENQAFHRMIIDSETGAILAVGRLHFVSQTEAQVRYMAVADCAKGKGLGKQMMAALEQVATQYGATKIVLNAREVALGFYLSVGYQQLEKTHVLYGEIQHYLMEKALPAAKCSHLEQAKALQQVWHDTIPMAKAMNLSANYFDTATFCTSADLNFNKNLHNTMFAGSIYTLATLTGWGWMYLLLQNENLTGDIVLADANIKYFKPLAGVGYAKVEQQEVEGDLSSMCRGRNGRLTIKVGVYCGDTLCAQFSGKFVAVLPKAA